MAISPYSISTALTMCYLFGAEKKTAAELKELLCLESLSDEQIISMNSCYSHFLSTELGTDTSLELAVKLYHNSQITVNKKINQHNDNNKTGN